MSNPEDVVAVHKKRLGDHLRIGSLKDWMIDHEIPINWKSELVGPKREYTLFFDFESRSHAMMFILEWL